MHLNEIATFYVLVSVVSDMLNVYTPHSLIDETITQIKHNNYRTFRFNEMSVKYDVVSRDFIVTMG